jgi:membrane-associated phospholipid phosphatase
MLWALAGAAAMVGLGLVVGGGPTAADTWVAERIGGPSPLLDTLSLTTHPVAVIAIITVIVGLTAREHPRVALLAVAGPAVAVTLNTLVLKPLFGRVIEDHAGDYAGNYYAYPSGHTASLVAVLAVPVIVAGARWVAVVVPLVVIAGVAIVGMGYHHATDVLGAALWSAAVVTFLWGTLTRSGHRRHSLATRRSVADSPGDFT